jgi:hypothetical protein
MHQHSQSLDELKKCCGRGFTFLEIHKNESIDPNNGDPHVKNY